MASEQYRRVAVVLFNLGAPDRPAAVAPFLRNLFLDPAILRMPWPLRAIVARIIAAFRRRPAMANYALLGGSSPLLDITRQQAKALQAVLPNAQIRCFIAMRYWHPFAGVVAQAVRAWKAEAVVLLPLYPQFSTTTTGSSFKDWHKAAGKARLHVPTFAICCYPANAGLIASQVELLRQTYDQARAALPEGVAIRVLFTAHGLPEAIVAAGDPYQWQVGQTVQAVLSAWSGPALDTVICYQSRATPQRWLEPSTISEIERAARDGVAVLLVPIAFVSEHSETLVELDIEYRHLAEQRGVPGFFRAPTPSLNAAFIAGLQHCVSQALDSGIDLQSDGGGRVCPANFAGCPCGGQAQRQSAR